MIFDNMKNCKLYYGVHKNFNKAFDFIKKATAENLSAGKYEIDGNDVYASVQDYTTKGTKDGIFEGHEKYIDIQYIISGTEEIDVMDISKATVRTAYDGEIDAAFYESNDDAVKSVLTAGEYGIFMPYDIHRPGMVYKSPSDVKKIVVKVKVEG